MSVLNIDEQSADQKLKISPRNYGPDEDVLASSAALTFGATVLGIPVGSNPFITNWLNQQILIIRNDISNILSFPHLQTQWVFINYIIKHKANYWLRNIPPTLCYEFCDQFNELLLETF